MPPLPGDTAHLAAQPRFPDPRRLSGLGETLVSLARSIDREDLDGVARRLTEAAADAIEVERASLWLFREDRSGIRCVDLFERSSGRHTSGLELEAKDYPTYFGALESERCIAAADAQTDRMTREFRDGYLLPLGIGAMLDAPVRVGSRIVGVVCQEHVGGGREWTPEERAFAGSLGDLVALAVEAGERRRAEEELRSSQEQLRHSQKMEAVGRLAGGVAHDFNNLTTAILGFGKLLAKELPPADPRRMFLDEILKAGERAAGLTRQLLIFTRKQVAQPSCLALNQVVERMQGLLKRLIGDDVQLDARLEPGLWQVRADAGHVEQILMNLAVNARDAMPDGGRLVIATANERLEAPQPGVPVGDWVTLAVEDSGAGMTDEVKARIFEPFFTTKPIGKGTGLGLSTVYGIVDQLGGSIAVRSKPGAGARFVVRFPRYTGTGSAAGVPAHEAAPRTGLETVLLVEDDPQVRVLAATILRSRGYDVREVAGAHQALRVLEAIGSEIRLVLTDVAMPQMSGSELGARVAHQFPGIPVLYMSGYSEGTIEGHEKLPRDLELVQKPFTEEELLRRVREKLDRRSERHA
jgi:signal transduction histidine kinase/CheY-like chemotaxis protein